MTTMTTSDPQRTLNGGASLVVRDSTASNDQPLVKLTLADKPNYSKLTPPKDPASWRLDDTDVIRLQLASRQDVSLAPKTAHTSNSLPGNGLEKVSSQLSTIFDQCVGGLKASWDVLPAAVQSTLLARTYSVVVVGGYATSVFAAAGLLITSRFTYLSGSPTQAYTMLAGFIAIGYAARCIYKLEPYLSRVTENAYHRLHHRDI